MPWPILQDRQLRNPRADSEDRLQRDLQPALRYAQYRKRVVHREVVPGAVRINRQEAVRTRTASCMFTNAGGPGARLHSPPTRLQGSCDYAALALACAPAGV